MTAQFLYQVFPHWEKVSSRWQPLLIPLYQRLCTCPLFFTRVRGGQWVQLRDAVVMTSPADELSEAAAAAVIRVYEVSQVNLVRLPSHVLRGLTEAVLRTQQTSQQVSESIRGEGLSTLNKFDVVCPQHLSDLMKMDNRWSASLSREQKCLVLDYLCCHGDPFLLEDLELLPLADGTFSACSDHVVHVCRGQQDLDLLPGLHDRLCFVTHPEGLHGRLQRLAESGNLNVVGTRLFSQSTTFVAFVIVAPPVMFAALAKCNLSSQAHLYSINGKCACHMWKQK